MIFSILSGCLLLISCIILLLCLILSWETVSACYTIKQHHPQTNDTAPNSVPAAILIPAHNESKVIQACLLTLKANMSNTDTILVIADNCDDDTAAIAKAEGVSVLERKNPDLRGKGYALDFGLEALRANPPELIIMIDADCLVQERAIDALKAQVISTERPAQAIYLMQNQNNPSLKNKISAFAFKVKNWVRPLGQWTYQISCPLTGTGMAFPWNSLKSIDLANGDIVEDMNLGLELSISGYPPLLCPEANVTGMLPSQESAITSQRTRWEHGHIQTLWEYVPRLLGQAIIQKRLDLLATALDLAIPPLSLLVLMWTATVIINGFLLMLTAQWLPFTVVIFAGIMLMLAVLMSWLTFGKEDLSVKDLLSIPLYIIGKIPIYTKILTKPQSQWIKTERD